MLINIGNCKLFLDCGIDLEAATCAIAAQLGARLEAVVRLLKDRAADESASEPIFVFRKCAASDMQTGSEACAVNTLTLTPSVPRAQPAKKAKLAHVQVHGQRSLDSMLRKRPTAAIADDTAIGDPLRDISDSGAARHEMPPAAAGNDLSRTWSCGACTFVNDKPLAPVCAVCGSNRAGT